MKTKLVLWGVDAQDERVLIALQLRPKENKVDIWTFPENIATEEFSQKMLNEWRNDVETPFPEGNTHMERELSISESLLPDDLKVERGDIVNRAQTEWHFIVLSSKLNETYQTELQELREKVDQLSGYSSEVWEDLKGFWGKVQTQVRDRNLFREHANDLRDNTNELFAKLKELRKSLDNEFQKTSEVHLESFKQNLADIQERVQKGLNLTGIFEDLKNLQRKFRDTKLTRDHRSAVWEKLDGLFKEVKQRRFGSDASNNSSTPSERLKRRYDGLMNALDKMDQSINRDKRDLDFQDRRGEDAGGQLEAQLRQAKIMMIKERIRSKEEKMNEMLQTKEELEKRIEVQTEKDARRAQRDKVEAAKAEAAAKIKEEIKQAEKSREDSTEELEKAAAALKGKKIPFVKEEKPAPETEKPAAKKEESVVEKITETIEDTLEDVVDTVKAVAHVVGAKIDEAVENLSKKAEEDKVAQKPEAGVAEENDATPQETTSEEEE